MSSVKSEGPLFNAGETVLAAVNDALRDARDWGIGVIREDTPIVTGELRRGYEPQGNDLIVNEVPYFSYVEDGTKYFIGRGMVRRNLKAIEDRLTANLEKIVEDKLS